MSNGFQCVDQTREKMRPEEKKQNGEKREGSNFYVANYKDKDIKAK